MDIQDYKRIFEKLETETLKERLKDALEGIKFLQSIYETGGANSHFSKEFRDAAYTERQEMCQGTSAIYSILRNRGETI